MLYSAKVFLFKDRKAYRLSKVDGIKSNATIISQLLRSRDRSSSIWGLVALDEDAAFKNRLHLCLSHPPLPPRQLSIPATTQSPTILSPASSPMSGTEGPQQVSVTNRTEGETMILSNQRACLYFNSWNATCTSPLNCKTYQIHQIFHDLSFIQNEQSMLPIPWYGLKIGYQGNKRKKSSEGK